ncbi:MAG: type II toxin-antitoxin system Phd/YefM family antitoxin [Planctomycetes bacterium]|nr:type II toxin-antitoxin system Phd/YefM family antitoxin [Planctomycetota bacterium]
MPRPVRIAEDVVPINEFKTNASKLINRMKETQRPMIITQNGRASAVLLTPEEFDALSSRGSFVEAVREGLADLEAGHTFTSAEVLAHVKAVLGR